MKRLDEWIEEVCEAHGLAPPDCRCIGATKCLACCAHENTEWRGGAPCKASGGVTPAVFLYGTYCLDCYCWLQDTPQGAPGGAGRTSTPSEVADQG